MVAEDQDVGGEMDPGGDGAEVAERGQWVPVAAAADRSDVGRDDDVLTAAQMGVAEPISRLGDLRHVRNGGVDLPRRVVVGKHGEHRCREAEPQRAPLEGDGRFRCPHARTRGCDWPRCRIRVASLFPLCCHGRSSGPKRVSKERSYHRPCGAALAHLARFGPTAS